MKQDDIVELIERIAEENKDNATLFASLMYVAHKFRQYIHCNCNKINEPVMDKYGNVIYSSWTGTVGDNNATGGE